MKSNKREKHETAIDVDCKRNNNGRILDVDNVIGFHYTLTLITSANVNINFNKGCSILRTNNTLIVIALNPY